MSGCLIALLVVGGIFMVLLLIGGVAVYRFLNTDTGKKVVSALDQTVKLAEEGMNAPGAAEVRKAGCDTAMVMDMGKVMKLVETFVDAGSSDKLERTKSMTMVVCNVQLLTSPPSCETVAQAYGEAVAAQYPHDFEFVVNVQKQGANKPLCQGRYGLNGQRLGDL